MSYISNIDCSVVEVKGQRRGKVLGCRSASVIGALLLAALVGFTGCPADGDGSDTTPPEQSVSLNELNADGTNLLFTLVNQNDEAVQIQLALSPAAPEGAMIVLDGEAVVFTDAARIALTATDDANSTKQIEITGVANSTEYTLTAATFDTNGNAQSETASEWSSPLRPRPLTSLLSAGMGKSPSLGLVSMVPMSTMSTALLRVERLNILPEVR